MTQALQASMANGGPGAGAMPDGAARGGPALDPDAYAAAMTGVLQNPQFMQMAEQLGQQIMTQDPGMAAMMKSMHDPNYRENLEDKLKELKQDPELAPIMQEIEQGGPAAMMKYWDDPAVLEKLSKAMGDAFDMEAITAQMGAGRLGQHDEEEEEEEGEEDPQDEDSLHGAASSGNEAKMKELIKEGADVNVADGEGRTSLHFACGYGEVACATLLLDSGANINAVDDNRNTPLHYSAGYGQAVCVELLLKRGARQELKNQDGKSAREVAELNQQEQAVQQFDGHNSSVLAEGATTAVH
ncbi:hypothetical protein WJX81_006603 [Elliptochloris bilobata]|uniref:STI1/HOP DP domain-containing protein n=1 Tax=Elliptochloris bilobata TaxID=381761 RepID=A0AAW1RNU4_9CHLO